MKKKRSKRTVKRATSSKRKTTRRAAGSKRRATVKKRAAVSKARGKALKPIGRMTHYFPHVKAGVIKVTRGILSVGDTIHIKGHTTDFKQKVLSLQLGHQPIQKAKKGQEVGIRVKSRVRQNDLVYKL